REVDAVERGQPAEPPGQAAGLEQRHAYALLSAGFGPRARRITRRPRPISPSGSNRMITIRSTPYSPRWYWGDDAGRGVATTTHAAAPRAGPRAVPIPPITAISTNPIERSNANVSPGSMKLANDALIPPHSPTTAPDSMKIRSWYSVAEIPTSAAAS